MTSTRHSTLSQPRDDELVEEMYDALSRFAGHIARYQASEDRHAQHECTMAHAHAFVDSTLKAVVDGKVKLPGEVGRTSFGEKDWMTAIYGWFVDLWRRWQGGRGTIIVLRKKEEK